MTTRARPGRPRLTEHSDDTTTREQLLETAAALFTQHGFAGTTTRMIAERVGIRQASLYYHFAGKDDLLCELLADSVRPSLAVVAELETGAGDRAGAAAALHRLACFDVATLARTPHNVATLYLLPETQQPRFAGFHADRAALSGAYGRLGQRAASAQVAADLGPRRLGELLIAVVEVVIWVRRDRDPDDADTHAVATSCLRLCGLDDAEIETARAAAVVLSEVQQ